MGHIRPVFLLILLYNDSKLIAPYEFLLIHKRKGSYTQYIFYGFEYTNHIMKNHSKYLLNIKRIMNLTTLFFVLLFLVACKDNTEQNIDFSYEVIEYFMGFAATHENTSYIFNELSELESHQNISDPLKEKYDEEYFNQSILIVLDIVHVYINASKPVFTVQQINQYESSLNIRLIHNILYLSDVQVFLTFIFIEIDRSELSNDEIDQVNILHLDARYYYQIQSDSPNSLLLMFSPSWEGEHKFQLAWNHEWFNGTLKMSISKDFDTIDIYDIEFSDETPNIYDLPTEAQIINFTEYSQMTFIYGGESYLNTPIT